MCRTDSVPLPYVCRTQSYEEDVKLAQQPSLTPRERVAVALRLGEKKIINSTMEAVRRRLAPIRGIPTKSGAMQVWGVAGGGRGGGASGRVEMKLKQRQEWGQHEVQRLRQGLASRAKGRRLQTGKRVSAQSQRKWQ